MFVSVAKVSEILEGRHKIVSLSDMSIAIFKRNDRFFAVQNSCPHRGGPACEGESEGHIITCPWHGWQFSIANGLCLNAPGMKLQTFEVKVENGEILLNC